MALPPPLAQRRTNDVHIERELPPVADPLLPGALPLVLETRAGLAAGLDEMVANLFKKLKKLANLKPGRQTFEDALNLNPARGLFSSWLYHPLRNDARTTFISTVNFHPSVTDYFN